MHLSELETTFIEPKEIAPNFFVFAPESLPTILPAKAQRRLDLHRLNLCSMGTILVPSGVEVTNPFARSLLSRLNEANGRSDTELIVRSTGGLGLTGLGRGFVRKLFEPAVVMSFDEEGLRDPLLYLLGLGENELSRRNIESFQKEVVPSSLLMVHGENAKDQRAATHFRAGLDNISGFTLECSRGVLHARAFEGGDMSRYNTSWGSAAFHAGIDGYDYLQFRMPEIETALEILQRFTGEDGVVLEGRLYQGGQLHIMDYDI